MTERSPSVGQILKARREERGVSRIEAARATKIPLPYLRALEEDDYRLLPDEAYLSRFVSDYSRFLGLDPLQMEELFRVQLEKISGPGRFLDLPLRPYVLSLRLLLGVAAAGGMGVVLFFLIFSFLTNRETPMVSREEKPSSPSQQVQAAQSPAPVVSPPGPGVSMRGQQVLTIRAEQATWVALRVDGGAVQEVLLRAGETVNWAAEREFRLTVGNAGGVALTLNGLPLPPLGPPGQVVRDVILPAAPSAPPRNS